MATPCFLAVWTSGKALLLSPLRTLMTRRLLFSNKAEAPAMLVIVASISWPAVAIKAERPPL